ncbi:hypothetical protein JGI3_00001 [Candidatus Kryptobacter tengchongensis]|nr:hypothetical protein JGI3_00001 [Candidatus Kryptobacter tengchongensis]
MYLLENEIYRIRERVGDIYSLNGNRITVSNVNLEGEFTYEVYVDVWNKSAREIFQAILNSASPKELSELLPGFIYTFVSNKDQSGGFPIESQLVSGGDYSLFRITGVSHGSKLFRYLPYESFKSLSAFRLGDFYTLAGNKIYITDPTVNSILVTCYRYVSNAPGYFSPVVRDKIIDRAVQEINLLRFQGITSLSGSNNGGEK